LKEYLAITHFEMGLWIVLVICSLRSALKDLPL
jgi:hypothetical protein